MIPVVVAAAVLVAGLATSSVATVHGIALDRVRSRALRRLVARPQVVPSVVLPGWVLRAGTRFTARRSALRYEEGLPDALDHMAAAIRAGASTVQALVSAAEVSDATIGADLAAVARQVERGASLDDALGHWERARPVPAVGLTVSALGLGSRFGGREANAIDAISDAVRTRSAVRREVRALSAQARASAWVMSVTPLAFAAVAAALDRRIAAVLLASPLGWACLAGGLALNAAAAIWMARIVAAPGAAA